MVNNNLDIQQRKPNFSKTEGSNIARNQQLANIEDTERKKWLIPGLVVLVIISLGIAGYFSYQYYQLKAKQNVPTTTIPTTELTPSQTQEDGWVTYTHTKFADKPDWQIPWKGFKLYYPSSWIVEEIKDEASPSLNLKISKENGDYLEIIQGAGGGGRCIFPDEGDYETFEGMGMKYAKYSVISKGNDITWRLADYPYPDDLWTHGLCEQNKERRQDSDYYDSTIVGFTKIKASTPESVKELKEILTKLEIIN